MRLHWLRFSIRGMMVAVAAVALVLGAGVAFLPMIFPVCHCWVVRWQHLRQAGSRQYTAVRPRAQRWERVLALACGLLLIVPMSHRVAINSPAPGRACTTTDVVMNLVDVWILGTCGALVCMYPCLRPTYLEFREHGLLWSTNFYSWDRIRGWEWVDEPFVLRVKVPNHIAAFRLTQEIRRRSRRYSRTMSVPPLTGSGRCRPQPSPSLSPTLPHRLRCPMPEKPATVEEYLAALPEDRRSALQGVRQVILRNLDKDYEEGIQYGMIGYYVPHRVHPAGYHCDPKQPLPFAALASQKNYMSLYLMCVYADSEQANSFREAWRRPARNSTWASRASASRSWTTWHSR